MLTKKEILTISKSFLSGTAFSLVMYLTHLFLNGSEYKSIHRLILLLGGDFFGGGYIQWITYVAFVWAILEMNKLNRKIVAESTYFDAELLPSNEKHIFVTDDVYVLHQKIKDFEKKHVKTLLTQLIKNCCAKFRSTRNISEVLDVLNILTDLHREASEMEQTNIRYLLWAIPSLGFIGTVLGISQALMIAGSNDMNAITLTLGVAFDTTLIALVLSIVLMWIFHDLQRKTDTFHVKSKEYVIENLINKIELS